VPPLGTARVGVRRLRGVSVGVFTHAIDERFVQQELQNAESRRAVIRNVPGSGEAFVAGVRLGFRFSIGVWGKRC
jgi:hypothetical protein